jgi:transketolase
MKMVFKKISDPDSLEKVAREIRIRVIESLAKAGSGHLGGSLGLADVFTVLYFNEMDHKPSEPGWPSRDRLILSIGHVAPVLYATLAKSGYFPEEELLTLRKLGSRLQGHPARDRGLPGIEISSGSLGQGLSVAVGLALSAKMDGHSWKVYSVHGDGELQEGSIWEAAMSATHHKLNNLRMIVDRNGVQIDGRTDQVMNIEPLRYKFESFGWQVVECDGNHIESLLRAFARADHLAESGPVVILAKTIMGKGVSSIEGDYRWHGAVPASGQELDFILQVQNINKEDHGL